MSEPKVFSGRPVMAGSVRAPAAATRRGFNTLASFQKSVMAKAKVVVCADQNNADLFGKVLTGVALCLPRTIGSTTGGMVLQTVASMGIAPAALLFADSVDSLAAAGIILAATWNGRRIITVDRLGTDFLEAAMTAREVEVREDGTVTLHYEVGADD